MSRKSLGLRLSVISVAALTMLASASTATMAQEPRDAEPIPEDAQAELVGVVSQPMVVVGFDADVARANGYEVATKPDGTEYRVDSPNADSYTVEDLDLPSEISPADVRTGNCGSSYAFLYDVGTRTYQVDTGFGVYNAAIGYTWSANVIAPSAAYNYTHRWHGALWFNNAFEMSSTATISSGSWATVKATGWTTHANGDICRSLGPIDSEAIY